MTHLDGPEFARDEHGRWGFRWERLEPIEGPPTPIYDDLERYVGQWRVVVSSINGEAWVYDRADDDGYLDPDSYGITIRAEDDFTAVLDAIAEMRQGPFPRIGWVGPDGRRYGPGDD